MNVLPDALKYDEKEPPEPEPEIKEVITETGDKLEIKETSTGEVNPNFIYDDDLPLEKESDPMPEFIPKPQPQEKEIFQAVQLPVGKPKKLTKSGRPRKPMSEEHKQKLAVAREKANAKKRYLQEQRKKAKQEEAIKKEQEVNQPIARPPTPQLANAVEPVVPEAVPPQIKHVGITKEDLDKSQMETILKIEAMRKSRKAEKKKAKQIEQYNKETINTIKKMNWRDTAGSYADCF